MPEPDRTSSAAQDQHGAPEAVKCQSHVYVKIGRNWRGQTIMGCNQCGHRYVVRDV